MKIFATKDLIRVFKGSWILKGTKYMQPCAQNNQDGHAVLEIKALVIYVVPD